MSSFALSLSLSLSLSHSLMVRCSKSTFVIVMDFSPADVSLIMGLLQSREPQTRLANIKVLHGTAAGRTSRTDNNQLSRAWGSISSNNCWKA